MKEIGILAAAARSDAEGSESKGDEPRRDEATGEPNEGADSRGGKANGEPAEEGSGAEALCSRDARLGVDREVSMAGVSATIVRKVILRWIQSIDGLCRVSQVYPRTREAERSSGVSKNRTECRAPQGNSTSMVQDCWIKP